MESHSLFQPKSLKRKNLKRLALDSTSGSGSSPDVSTGGTATPSFADNLYLRRKFKPSKLIIENSSTVRTNSVSLQPSPTVHPSPTASEISSTSITPTDEYTEESDSLVSDFYNLSLFQDNSIQLEDLVQLGRIGSGNSGTVIKTLHVPDSRIIAKKTIPVDNKPMVKNQLVRELTIMKNVKTHANIVGFYGAFYNTQTNNEIVILMEYMDCGSLDKILVTYKRWCSRQHEEGFDPRTLWFTELSISKISHAVLNGLTYLYNNYKIIHRDIKPSNVLINSKGFVKICDFGVSKKLINSMADTFVGTSTYMSPERIQGSVYSTKGDVWSLGLMIIELVTGQFPLGGHSDTPEGILDLLQRIVNEAPPKLPSHAHYSREMVDFVNRCCVKEERERSSLQELLCHDFITTFASKEEHTKEFRHWCKKIKKRIKEDKMVRREQKEREKLEKRQLERSAHAARQVRS